MSKLLALVCAFASAVALAAANSNDSVFNCVFGFGGQSRVRRSVFASVALNGNAFAVGALSTNPTCAFIEKSVDCVKKATGTELADYVDVFGKTASEHCGDNYDEGFWSGFEELEKDWQAESKRDKCEGPVDNTDAACKKLSTCTFGTAFDGVEGRYSKDVTDFATDFTKFVTGAVFEAFIPGELPQSCEFVFKP